jgi:hypothetical protein
MFCVRCGATLTETQQFCPSCGAPAGGAVVAPPAARGRVASHVRLVGILWLVVSAMRLIPGILMLAMLSHGGAEFAPEQMPLFVQGIMRMVGMALVAASALGIAAGWGLLTRQPWARMLAIVMSFFALLEIPFGTALGIYTLWVLLPAQSAAEYRTA